ncbi:hypothetical protein GMB86_09320 [Terrilactibacillus sp. BCM23-1]|uniref:Uncharacterized protein n=1 Tax=Terrilactibacillus tamarindi TaxID=2599694 RepID=A0A6N8CT21_9BACI|nr:hypothetical protein [Terrilactibacillus tamarindi]MTT32203.1 hypothetical protein [Terrilactibacillus tamarindi]
MVYGAAFIHRFEESNSYKQIQLLEKKTKDIFVQTDGAFILSVSRIGVVTGSSQRSQDDAQSSCL